MEYWEVYRKSNKVRATVLRDHITHKSGKRKTVCVTACLTSFGVPVDSFNYTGSAFDSKRENILRRHGYAVRSRMSKMPKNPTIGTIRKAIAKLDDKPNTRYLIIVTGHAMVLNKSGDTIVDTAPRIRDKRKVLSVKAVFRP